jgi:hypothetical protein
MENEINLEKCLKKIYLIIGRENFDENNNIKPGFVLDNSLYTLYLERFPWNKYIFDNCLSFLQIPIKRSDGSIILLPRKNDQKIARDVTTRREYNERRMKELKIMQKIGVKIKK